MSKHLFLKLFYQAIFSTIRIELPTYRSRNRNSHHVVLAIVTRASPVSATRIITDSDTEYLNVDMSLVLPPAQILAKRNQSIYQDGLVDNTLDSKRIKRILASGKHHFLSFLVYLVRSIATRTIPPYITEKSSGRFSRVLSFSRKHLP